MLLLGLCGVAKEDIVASYQVSRTYLKDHVELNLPPELMNLNYTEPEWMEETYDFLMNKYGSFEEYFLTVGFSKKDIKKLRKRLLTNIFSFMTPVMFAVFKFISCKHNRK